VLSSKIACNSGGSFRLDPHQELPFAQSSLGPVDQPANQKFLLVARPAHIHFRVMPISPGIPRKIDDLDFKLVTERTELPIPELAHLLGEMSENRHYPSP
jgi:hypothetical protein